MNIGDLYQFVLVLVLVAVVVTIGVLLLDKMGQTTGLTSAAQLSANYSRDALSPITKDYFPIIVIIGIFAVILGMLVHAFAGPTGRK